MVLTAKEREWLDTLKKHYPHMPDVMLAQRARTIVADEERRKRLTEIVRGSLGWKERLSLWILWNWWKENGMNFIGEVLKNGLSGPSTTIVGVLALMLAGFVTFYCSTDATGGWIDPRCATYVKVGLWLSGLGHILAPGFTATIGKGNAA